MALGRIREALADCHRAAAVDPEFSKVRLRAANCHLMLGEFATASALYSECKEAGGGDAKILAEVSLWILAMYFQVVVFEFVVAVKQAVASFGGVCKYAVC